MDIRQMVLCLTFSVGVLPVGSVEASQSLDRSQRAYKAAMETSDEGRRTELLKRSYNEYETYEAAIALGELHLGAGEWGQAREWLNEAYELGGTDEARSRALFRIGESYAGEGNWARAVDYLDAADGLYDLPMIRQALREARRAMQGQVVPSAAIAETLARRGGGVRPRIDLDINFEFDSARMTRDGRAQAEQLGEAMLMVADDVGRREEWLVVGHTDAQGARSYNHALSLRRAEAVRAYLAEEFGFDRRDIDVDGRGEDELLDTAMSEAAHSLNRRVEVVRR